MEWKNGRFCLEQDKFPRNHSYGPTPKQLTKLVTKEMEGYHVIKWFDGEGQDPFAGEGLDRGWFAGTIVGPSPTEKGVWMVTPLHDCSAVSQAMNRTE
jgi:hypothetical protein